MCVPTSSYTIPSTSAGVQNVGRGRQLEGGDLADVRGVVNDEGNKARADDIVYGVETGLDSHAQAAQFYGSSQVGRLPQVCIVF